MGARGGAFMNTFKVYFSDGDTVVTGFNGSLVDAIAYYVGQWFNTGTVDDHMVMGVFVEEVKS